MEENRIKELFTKMVNKETLTQEEQTELAEKILEIDGVKELVQVLILPDEDFSLVAPVVLDAMEDDLSQLNTRLTLIQTLQANGIDLKDDSIIESIRAAISKLPTQNTDAGVIFTEIKVDFLQAMLGLVIDAVRMTRVGHSRVVNLFVQRLRDDIKVPQYAHDGDAGMDIYAPEDIEILPGEQKIIPIGIKVAIPRGYALLVQPRSGLSARTKLRITNTPGLIDSPYRDEVGVIVENIEPAIKDIGYEFDENGRPVIQSILHGSPINIDKGERFAQLRLVEAPVANWIEVSDVSIIGDNRQGGFGSTGQ